MSQTLAILALLLSCGDVATAQGHSLPNVYRTTDGGDTWGLSLVGSRVTDLNVRGSEVVAVANQKRVYSSVDGGETWRRDSADVRGADIYYTAFPDSGDAIIGTASGSWLVSNGIPSVVAPEGTSATSAHVWLDERSGRLVVDHPSGQR
ncbi:MAG TPA: hypothetical protein VNA88_17035 [Candidatus Kapabacteria bacterium]|jgi:hypothetical protein|nr:hypothetical protein [Candidatus Kapabacteria bacterium]